MSAPRSQWQHRIGDRYMPVFGDYHGNARDGFYRAWSRLSDPAVTRAAAELLGLRSQGSDDFNIAVVRDGRVVALLWMTEDMAEDADVLDSITAELLS